ncbi:hypothetical protein BDC45DRAFT_565004 [Circinella umbellata]|nr:hypothetical protein BDC45DRAFT_565004 [Circinella umbellata]
MSTLHPPSPPTLTPQQQKQQQIPQKQIPSKMSKVILRTALQKANSAVMCDSSNDVMGAIDAYSEAISLLNRVLTTVEKGSDRRRLQEIHDSYSERIRLLSAISPKSEIDDLYETFDDEEEQKVNQVMNEYYGEEEEEEEEEEEQEEEQVENDAKSWLSKPAKRKFSTRQTGAPQYASIIRHTASSSSLESQQYNSTKRNSNSTTATITTPINKTDPPSPVSSKSTPTHSANRKSDSSNHSINTTEDVPTIRSNSVSTTSSFESLTDEQAQEQQISLSQVPTHHSVSSQPLSPPPPSQEQQQLEGSASHSLSNTNINSNTPTTSLSSTQVPREQPTMTLPPLKSTKIEAAGERTSSLRHQGSNASIRSTVNPIRQSSITSNTVPITHTTNINTGSGFTSIRKKSSNRLSRVSMDGASTMRRNHSNGTTPLLGLFMRSQNGNDQESSMDYFGHNNNNNNNGNNRIGMAYSTDSVMPLENNNQQPPLHLVLSIEKSMDQGAYITPRLYIPKNMWNQPSIRLPHVEIKVAACESLMNDLAKLEQWHKLDDLTGSLKVLEILEDAVESLQANLAKKLKRESMSAEQTTSSPHTVMTPQYDSSTSYSSSNSSTSSKKSQAFMSWGSKLSKSVERMNAFSLTKTEDQYRNYIEVLHRMLIKIHILTDWWNHYIEMKKDTGRMSPVCDVVLQRLTRICDVVDIVVGGFVVRDMAILLGKWLKRGGTWVNE